ncbi:ATP-dependent zinc protease [Ferrimonas balearica]|uniref:ATP-dependent zinc protease family protein n=1 Tax=Ferrimonas balearica TaxID=44012 RepID=UPI001C99606F|nr:ATP-dependent zinc protease [Ferrimonas balearica]MBY5991010.1 ATP-dependent zinc protease [Ferrimonas balearica]
MQAKTPIGWREWVHLPQLGIPHIKAKIDTGAKTCALHAFRVDPFEREGQHWVRFALHPYQDDTDTVVECEAPVVDYRTVTNSGGHQETRYVIATQILAGDRTIDAEITLTNRETMRFRMLLGRNALMGHFLVDCDAAFLLETPPMPESERSEHEDCDTVEE